MKCKIKKTRENLTALHFVTIDSETTQDMDDALYIEPITSNSEQTGWQLVVAIADPTTYIALHSQIEKDAKQLLFHQLSARLQYSDVATGTFR